MNQKSAFEHCLWRLSHSLQLVFVLAFCSSSASLAKEQVTLAGRIVANDVASPSTIIRSNHVTNDVSYKKRATLILIRHGESIWNKQNRFTGWVDVPLTEKGRREAILAADQIKGITLDAAYTSKLQRAQQSLQLILDRLDLRIPVIADKALNERHYGLLQGLNKEWTEKIFGTRLVQKWRRSYEGTPPFGESLRKTSERTLPYFYNNIVRDLMAGKNVLVVAHGNSLRSIILSLEKLSPDEVPDLQIDTGVPIVYQIGKNGSVLSKQVLEEKAVGTPTLQAR